MPPSASTPVPEAKAQLQAKFRASLSASDRAELMLLVLKSVETIQSDVQTVFSHQDCLEAYSPDDDDDDAGFDDRRSGSPDKHNMMDHHRLHRSEAYRLELLTQELGSTESRTIQKAAEVAVQSWRSSVLTQFGTVLGVSSNELMRLNASYRFPHVAWNQTTVFPHGTRPFPTKLVSSLTEDVRKEIVALALNVFILVLVKYNAYARILMQLLTANLNLPPSVLVTCENEIAQVLLCDPNELKSKADEVTRSQQADASRDRKWKIGAATIAGAAVIGLTGGLAAPFLVGSVTALLGGLGLGGVAIGLTALGVGNPLVIAGIFGAFGGRMSKRAVDELTKEVNDFRLIPLRKRRRNQSTEKAAITPHKERLRVVVGISGLIEDPRSLVNPWSIFSAHSIEPFALRYEFATLYCLGTTLASIFRKSAFSLAQASVLQLTIPAVMAAGLVPFGLIQLGGFLDNPFRVAMTRSDKAGKVLARVLIEKAYGERPVTLVGFSLGARVIYSCLLELAEQDGYGLVENVVLIGAPTPSDSSTWRKMRAVVAGRLVNAYNPDDLLLAFLYRASHAQLNIAGLKPVHHVPGVENVNVTDLVHGHRQYLFAAGAVMEAIGGFELDLDEKAVQGQKAMLKDIDQHEKEMHEQARREGKLKGLEDEHGKLILGKHERAQDRGEGYWSSSGATSRQHRQAGADLRTMAMGDYSRDRATPEQTFSFYSERDDGPAPSARSANQAHPRLVERANGRRYLVFGDEELEIEETGRSSAPPPPPPPYSAVNPSQHSGKPSSSEGTRLCAEDGGHGRGGGAQQEPHRTNQAGRRTSSGSRDVAARLENVVISDSRPTGESPGGEVGPNGPGSGAGAGARAAIGMVGGDNDSGETVVVDEDDSEGGGLVPSGFDESKVWAAAGEGEGDGDGVASPEEEAKGGK